MATRSPLIPAQSQEVIAEDILLHDDSGEIFAKGKAAAVTLSAQFLVFRSLKKASKSLGDFPVSTIVGCKNKSKKSGNKTRYTIEVAMYVTKTGGCCCCCKNKEIVRKKKTFKIEFGANGSLCQRWTNAINCASVGITPLSFADNGSDVLPPKVRKYLVFVNPVSGKGTAVKIWNKHVLPLLEDANVDIDLVETKHANHAKQVVSETDLKIYDAVLVVGGDGLLFEVINGVANRSDSSDILDFLPISPIPGGTSNGLVKSILFESGQKYNAMNATFTTVKGTPYPLDLSRVVTRSGHVHYSFLILGWGLISDVDILSESMRFMGELRMYLAAVYFIFKKNRYRGRLKMKLVEHRNTTRFPPPVTHNGRDLRFPSTDSRALKDGWLTIEDEFAFVWVVQSSHASSSMYSGPGCTIADGIFTVFVVRNISISQSIGLMLAIDEGGHVDNPLVERYQASAYSLEPLTDKGLYSLDGEQIEYGPIQATMMPSAMKVFNMPTVNNNGNNRNFSFSSNGSANSTK